MLKNKGPPPIIVQIQEQGGGGGGSGGGHGWAMGGGRFSQIITLYESYLECILTEHKHFTQKHRSMNIRLTLTYNKFDPL